MSKFRNSCIISDTLRTVIDCCVTLLGVLILVLLPNVERYVHAVPRYQSKSYMENVWSSQHANIYFKQEKKERLYDD